MKNKLLLAVFCLCASMAVSCTKNVPEICAPEIADTSGKCEVCFRVKAPGTKATVTDDADKGVSYVQVFIFLGEELDLYGTGDGNSVTMECNQGERDIYVLTNAPALPFIETKTDLLSSVSELEDSNVADCDEFQMIGMSTEEIGPENTEITVPVKHVSARITVSSIRKEFESSALEALEFKVLKMYLVNVVGDCLYSGDTYTPKIWHNKKSNTGSLSNILSDEINYVIESEKSYDTKHIFYAYPNPTEEDSSDATWSARYTRLVVEAKLGDNVFYYPISIPNIEGNKSYNISEILITRPGSTSPDVPVSTLSCKFSVDVEPWVDVEWTEGTTI